MRVSHSMTSIVLTVGLIIGFSSGWMMMSSTASSSGNILQSKAVLVIGGTGRVGRAIVPKLIKQGFSVRVLCRNIVAARELSELHGADLREGDVCNMDSLLAATVDCSAVVDVHGMKPSRFAKITDLFNHPRNIPYHPYNVNYLGVKRILAAMQINNVRKIVRITGAFVDKSAFSPLRVLFNVLLSMTSAWHEASEIAIRNSGLDYTVIRPTEIVNETSVAITGNGSLYLIPGDSPGAGILSHIPIQDLSDLLVMCVQRNSSSSSDVSMLSRSTAVCGTKKVQGPTTWSSLVETIPKDTKVLKLGNHKLAIALYVPMFFTFLAFLGGGLFVGMKYAIRMIISLYLKISVIAK